jgi:hypothetical protein
MSKYLLLRLNRDIPITGQPMFEMDASQSNSKLTVKSGRRKAHVVDAAWIASGSDLERLFDEGQPDAGIAPDAGS